MKKRAIILIVVISVCIIGITVALILDNNANTEKRKRYESVYDCVEVENV